MTAEYRAPTTRIGRLREALFLSIRAAGGINHPSAPDECLLKAPDEVYGRVKALRAERDAAIARATEAEAAHEDAMRGCLHTLELLNAAETRAEAAEAQVKRLRDALEDLLSDEGKATCSGLADASANLGADDSPWAPFVSAAVSLLYLTRSNARAALEPADG